MCLHYFCQGGERYRVHVESITSWSHHVDDIGENWSVRCLGVRLQYIVNAQNVIAILIVNALIAATLGWFGENSARICIIRVRKVRVAARVQLGKSNRACLQCSLGWSAGETRRMLHGSRASESAVAVGGEST